MQRPSSVEGSRPLAGHALRELDSSIRSVLAASMDALPQEDEQQVKRRADVLRTLKDMKFDEETLQRADQALKPKLNHRTQIERIVKQLGLAPDGDVAKLWIELTKATGRVHERSFHERLEADEAFRWNLRESSTPSSALSSPSCRITMWR